MLCILLWPMGKSVELGQGISRKRNRRVTFRFGSSLDDRLSVIVFDCLLLREGN
jgi:hypothetical protein